MPAPNFAGPNKWSHTPRKVFDSYVDRMAVKRQRDREDYRNDLQAIFQKLKDLQNQLTLLEEHVDQHCLRIDSDRDADPLSHLKGGTEEL